MSSARIGAVRLAGIAIIGMTGIKIVTAGFTGSLSILAQAADSFLDLMALAIVAIAIRIAVKPADTEHHFGHGKVENIAAAAQAVLIFTTAGFIIFAAIGRITDGSTVSLSEAGIAVMLLAIIISFLLSRRLRRAAQEADSLSLESMASNINADIYSAAAVLAGMLAIRIFNLTILDPVIALLVAVYILKIGYDVSRKALSGLIDVKLPEEEEALIKAVIDKHHHEISDYHKLRTRKSGKARYIDLHIVAPRDISVAEAHRLCDNLETEIGDRLSGSSLTIHVEPCDGKCGRCAVICDFRKSD